MIKSLSIKNLATIEDISLDFEEGFSILTGETGTGKSIIIGGIRLATGEKGSADLIRTGKKETVVEAIFYPPPNYSQLKSLLEEEGNEVCIQRSIPQKGYGRSYINGTLVPVAKIRDFRDNIVDIYGQNDHIFLRQLDHQLNYLDYFAEAVPLRKEVSRLVCKLRDLAREKKELENKENEREKLLDFLKFQIEEIEKAQLHRGEEEELRQSREILKNAEKVQSLTEEAINLSYSQEDSLNSLLARLQRLIQDLSSFDQEFHQANETIGQFAIFIKEFSEYLIKFQEKNNLSSENLEDVEERLSLIESLKRKYGKSIEEILSYKEKAKKDLEFLFLSHEKVSEISEEIEKIFESCSSKAQELASLRKKASRVLEDLIKKELNLLGMKNARFKVRIESFPFDINSVPKVKESGTENVEFLISPNPGEELKPLRKIASGGELSRLMLALKSLGKDTESLKTLIFDEIDSGIGGKTAEFVAQKLKQLSKKHQVICITHLPQIASFATHHYRIEKKVLKGRTYTKVKKLNFEERVAEIASLLAGSHITKATLQNAREMLEHNV